jgi:tetratricopeptide (TPR) repeat protein
MSFLIRSLNKSKIISTLATTICAASVVLCTARLAHAGDPAAERLYREGQAAAQARDYDKACKLFQESQNREPAPGTLLNLGDCEEHRGKLVRAAAQYRAAARLFQPGDARIDFATKRAASLEKRFAKVRIRTPKDSQKDLTVECDGEQLDAATMAGVVTMDPGSHVFVVRAPGRADVTTNVALKDGETRDIELGVGAVASSSPTVEPSVAPVVRSSSPAPRAAVAASPTPANNAAAPGGPKPFPYRTASYVSYGIGGAGAIAGVLTAVMATNKLDESRAICSQSCPDAGSAAAAEEKRSGARTMALLSLASFGVAAAGAGAGTFFMVKSVRVGNVAGAASPGWGLTVEGAF